MRNLRHRSLHTFIVLSLLLSSAPALAKETKAKKAVDPRAMMEKYRTLAAPGEITYVRAQKPVMDSQHETAVDR